MGKDGGGGGKMEEVVRRWRMRVRWRGLGEMEGEAEVKMEGGRDGWRKGGGGYELKSGRDGGQEEERKEGRKKSLAM